MDSLPGDSSQYSQTRELTAHGQGLGTQESEAGGLLFRGSLGFTVGACHPPNP